MTKSFSGRCRDMVTIPPICMHKNFLPIPGEFLELFLTGWRNNSPGRRRIDDDASGTVRDFWGYPWSRVARQKRSGAEIMKFTIEITRGSSPRERFQGTRRHHRAAADAIHEAERLLHTLRIANPENPPEGYRVLDRSGKLVDCGWGSARE